MLRLLRNNRHFPNHNICIYRNCILLEIQSFHKLDKLLYWASISPPFLDYIIPRNCKHFNRFAGSNLSKTPLHLWLCKCFSLVGATCGRPRAFTERPYGCGGTNLSTDLLLWGIYIKKRISPVRICLQTRNDARAELRAEMHLQNFEKLQS